MSYLILVLLILGLGYLIIHGTRKRLLIKCWKKSLHLEEHEAAFNLIYRDSNGFLLSQQARQQSDAMEYAYGEIEFLSFIALLSLVQLDENTVFYDLGSGTGKAVLACSMIFPVRKSIGIELFPQLYLDACQRVNQLAALANYSELASKIQFILGDFLEVNLQDATLIFINSTAFFGPTWEKLCARLDHLPKLNTVITTSKRLNCADFTLVARTRVAMSWGVVSAYIHQRKTRLD